MRFVADSGLWATGPQVESPPLVAVLEVSGAVLAWTVDDVPGASAPRLTLLDVARADWLWRILGESAHVALAAAVESRSPDETQTIDLNDVDLVAGSTAPLRRLALGHWLRRWWPASDRDGIAALDPALLDAEIATLTSDAQDFFSDDTFDSQVGDLLRPHAADLRAHLSAADPRVVDLVLPCVELADEVGADGDGWSELIAALDDSGRLVDVNPDVTASSGVRDDYALAAGPGVGLRDAGAIATGVGSIDWSAVPPGIFDAAENTAEWTITVSDSVVTAVVRTVTSGFGVAGGIPVRVRSESASAEGLLDADGRAAIPIVDRSDQPMTESAAWDHDWRDTVLTIGADVAEPRDTRDRVRAFARSRLDEPASDAFLAEIIAAESDY